MTAWIDSLTNAQLLAFQVAVGLGGVLCSFLIVMLCIWIDSTFGTHLIIPKE